MVRKRKGAFLGFLVYFLFGLYFLNSSLNIVEFPAVVLKIDRWIVLIGAVLIIVGAVNYLRISNIKKLREIVD